MPLTRTFFTAWLDDPDNPDDVLELHVEVRGADQLRAELEGKKLGVGLKDAMHQSFLWAWAAAEREGKFKGKFSDFRDRAIKVEGDDDEEPATVDPTPPAAIAG